MVASLEAVRKIIEEDLSVYETRELISKIPNYGDYKPEYEGGSFVRYWFGERNWTDDDTKKLREIVKKYDLKIRETYTLVDFRLYNEDGDCVSEVGVNNGIGYVSVNCHIGNVGILLEDLSKNLFNAKTDDRRIKIRLRL